MLLNPHGNTYFTETHTSVVMTHRKQARAALWIFSVLLCYQLNVTMEMRLHTHLWELVKMLINHAAKVLSVTNRMLQCFVMKMLWPDKVLYCTSRHFFEEWGPFWNCGGWGGIFRLGILKDWMNYVKIHIQLLLVFYYILLLLLLILFAFFSFVVRITKTPLSLFQTQNWCIHKEHC